MAEKKYEYVCTECGISEWSPKWYRKKRKYPNLCTVCVKLQMQENNRIWRENNPDKCEENIKKFIVNTKKRHANTSPEYKSEHAKRMRAAVKLSGEELRQKQQDFIDNAGDDYYKKYCEKRKQTALAFHAGLTPEEKEAHYRKVLKNNGRSKECDLFIETLNEHDIHCEVEKHIKGFFVDAVVIGTNIIIEYYGDMFHCNPTKFKDPLQVCSWLGGRTVQEQWDRDRRRLAALYRNNYIVIIVWGSDWKEDPNSVIKRIEDEISKCGIH